MHACRTLETQGVVWIWIGGRIDIGVSVRGDAKSHSELVDFQGFTTDNLEAYRSGRAPKIDAGHRVDFNPAFADIMHGKFADITLQTLQLNVPALVV
jgi:hypothetical protein